MQWIIPYLGGHVGLCQKKILNYFEETGNCVKIFIVYKCWQIKCYSQNWISCLEKICPPNLIFSIWVYHVAYLMLLLSDCWRSCLTICLSLELYINFPLRWTFTSILNNTMVNLISNSMHLISNVLIPIPGTIIVGISFLLFHGPRHSKKKLCIWIKLYCRPVHQVLHKKK